MKIPFDIKYLLQIESGEYKVETRSGNKVEIWKFDIKDEDYPIAGIVSFPRGYERIATWRIDGGFVLGVHLNATSYLSLPSQNRPTLKKPSHLPSIAIPTRATRIAASTPGQKPPYFWMQPAKPWSRR